MHSVFSIKMRREKTRWETLNISIKDIYTDISKDEPGRSQRCIQMKETMPEKNTIIAFFNDCIH